MNKENKYPDKRGLYKCIVDGKKMILTHHYCENNKKHWWTDTRGYDVVGCNIEVVEPFSID